MGIVTDYVRLRPTKNALVILLKNTHFSSENLAREHVSLSFEILSSLPLLVFKFRDVSKSFMYPLNYFNLANGEMGWLSNEQITIQLELSDTVVADQVSSATFSLTPDQTQEVRSKLHEQHDYTPEAIDLLEDFAQADANRYLG